MARVEPVARAAVDRDDAVLANELHAIDHGDDAALHVRARAANHEIQRRFGARGEEAIALDRLAGGIGE